MSDGDIGMCGLLALLVVAVICAVRFWVLCDRVKDIHRIMTEEDEEPDSFSEGSGNERA